MFVFELAVYVLERRRAERRRLLALMLQRSGKSDPEDRKGDTT